jgi:hypothetical protein
MGDGPKTGGRKMDNNNTNTVAETGTNSANLNELVETLANAINSRNMRTEKSILKDNFEKLSEEDREQAYAIWNEHKTKEANKNANKIADLEAKNAELAKLLNDYQTKEKQTNLRNAATATLKELGADNAKTNLLLDLANSRLAECVNDKNEFDNEKSKELFNEIAKKYEIKLEQADNIEQHQISVVKNTEVPIPSDKNDEFRKILGIKK